jgi:hypothetical protein
MTASIGHLQDIHSGDRGLFDGGDCRSTHERSAWVLRDVMTGERKDREYPGRRQSRLIRPGAGQL